MTTAVDGSMFSYGDYPLDSAANDSLNVSINISHNDSTLRSAYLVKCACTSFRVICVLGMSHYLPLKRSGMNFF